MRIAHVRFANCIFMALIVSSGQFFCIWYLVAMHLSLEILNRQQVYLSQYYTLYNTVFWIYELVLGERLFPHHFNPCTEQLINGAEHITFGLLICLKCYMYIGLTKRFVFSRRHRAWMASSIFNLAGIGNEFFQNWLCRRDIFILTADSIKDLYMNAAGTILFIAIVFLRTSVMKQGVAPVAIHSNHSAINK